MKTLLATLFAGMAMMASAQEPAVTMVIDHDQLIRQHIQQVITEQHASLKSDIALRTLAYQADVDKRVRQQLNLGAGSVTRADNAPQTLATGE